MFKKEVEIKFIKQTRLEWLQNVPEEIYHLVKNYNFYFAKVGYGYSNLSRDIVELVLEKHSKNKHKIILYNSRPKNTWYLVIYTKHRIDIYYTNEIAESWSRVKYFINKFQKAAERAKDDRLKEEVYNSKD